ncbi:MAG: bifunctional folylpolyglutamate synthase/dihydrofolate synthase, partial [Pseudanabaenaceae cyanobacterium]
SRDHWQRLGDSLAQIAMEKAGIIKANCPVVIGKLPEVARSVILNRAQSLHCPITEVTTPLPDHYVISLPGAHQRLNAAIAVATIQQLRGWHITEGHIYQGIASTQWQGRLEWTTYRGRQILLDGAHNVAGAETLRQYLDQTFPGQYLTWIIGILSTKDYRGILQTLVRAGDYLFPVEVPGHQSTSPQELVAALSVPVQTEICTNLGASLDRALTLDYPIVVCGSLYLLGEFKRESDRNFRHSF